MKKKITMGFIEEGLERGLSFEQIAKNSGIENYKEVGNKLESQYKEMFEVLKVGIENYKRDKQIIEDKQNHLIKDNKGLEDKLGTTIDDYKILKIERNRRIENIKQFLEKRDEDHLIDISEWAENKINKKWDTIKKHRDNKNTSEQKIKLYPKHFFLYLYEIDRRQNENKHIALVQKATGVRSVRNDFRELGVYIKGDAHGGEKRTFDKYKEQLKDPEIRSEIKRRLG